MIRPARQDDAPGVATLCHAFHAEHPLARTIPYDAVYVQQGVVGLIGHDDAQVFVDERGGVLTGVCAGVITSVLFNPDARVAEEIVWYVPPRFRRSTAGLRLFVAFEQWARSRGASHIIMVAHRLFPHVASIYEARGYGVYETRYVRKV